MKLNRQTEILRIIKEQSIKTHEELIDALKKVGIKVTQATVSRDIKELRLVKIPSKDGSIYVASQTEDNAGGGAFKNSVKAISRALNNVVVRTYPGMAGGVAAAVDNALGDKILGSIAGDDTLLIITSSETEAMQIIERVRMLFDYKGV